MNIDSLKKMLIIDEGLSLKPYKDTVGKLTIGVGRNLDDEGISEKEVDLMLSNDIQKVTDLLDSYTSWWSSMSDNRQLVLANMAFNLGVGPSPEEPTGKLLTFKNTLQAMKEGRYEDAAKGMENSAWYKQVGRRAVRLVNLMRAG